MSNKNRGFIRQITVKEMRTRHYHEMCQELAKGQTMHTPDTRNVRQEATSNPHSPTAPASEDVSPGDPTERYRIAKTHASSYNVTFFLLIIVHITDYHWDRHLYFVIYSHHAQTMTHTPSDDSILILRLVVLVACDSD
jgi:hypothetical protein